MNYKENYTFVINYGFLTQVVFKQVVLIQVRLYLFAMVQRNGIVLFKMFSRWFFANKKLIITLRTWKFGDVT